MEKLRYLQRNPVNRGLCQRPEDWAWSSFRHYATGEIGTVEIESQRTASRREAVTLKPMSQLQGPFDKLRAGYGAPAVVVEK